NILLQQKFVCYGIIIISGKGQFILEKTDIQPGIVLIGLFPAYGTVPQCEIGFSQAGGYRSATCSERVIGGIQKIGKSVILYIVIPRHTKTGPHLKFIDKRYLFLPE